MSIHAARSARARIKSLKTFLPPPEAVMARKDEFSTWFETEESVVCCRGADWCADDDIEGEVVIARLSVNAKITHTITGRADSPAFHITEHHRGRVIATHASLRRCWLEFLEILLGNDANKKEVIEGERKRIAEALRRVRHPSVYQDGIYWYAELMREGDVSITRRILHGHESDEQLHIRHKERHLGAVFADDKNGFDVYLVGPVRLTDEKERTITLSDALTRAILGLGSVVPMTGHEALEPQHTASMACRIAERASSLDTFTAYCMQERSSRRA